MADPYGNVPKSDEQPSDSNPPFFIQLPPTSSTSSSIVNDPQDLSGLRSPTGGGSVSSSPRSGHPLYRGIRSRSGKWVSEIREPRKSTRIWLGTYAMPEMAAAAYDVAAIALKGPDTALNFPSALINYPIPASSAASDIRAAAARAAASRAEVIKQGESSSAGGVENVDRSGRGRGRRAAVTSDDGGGCQEFMDEEELLNMPNLLAHMAEGMLVSPPRGPANDSPENSDGESLWSY
uniref:Transcription factor ERF16 n=1 Tax=Fragaria ananassa TaxID=3747 RepID=A0A3Q8T9Y9_FRAAN|nr:transcription factor ERF16 [Fragaria x ananassa]